MKKKNLDQNDQKKLKTNLNGNKEWKFGHRCQVPISRSSRAGGEWNGESKFAWHFHFLILILFLTWQAIEMKTYPDEIDIGQVQVDDLLDEDVPITEIQNTPPPPPISSHLSAPESSISLDTRSACGL